MAAAVEMPRKITPPDPLELQDRQPTGPEVTLSHMSDLVSERTGICRSFNLDSLPPGQLPVDILSLELEGLSHWFHGEHAELFINPDSPQKEPEGWLGHRYSVDMDNSLVRALGESMERHGCAIYDPHRLVRGTARELKDRAVPLENFSRLSREELDYLNPRYMTPYVEPDDDAEMRWEWAWSLTDERWKLVPASVVYQFYNRISPAENLFPLNSTGWAVHSTMEEAILTGLLEHVERDGFIIGWLNKTPFPEVDLDAVDHPGVREILEMVEDSTFEVRVFATNLDLEAPTFLAVMHDHGPHLPKFATGLGADLTPEEGILKALEELFMLHVYWINSARGPESHIHAPEEVVTLEDHALFWSVEDHIQEHAGWFWNHDRTVDPSELPTVPHGSVNESIEHLVETCRASGMEPLVVPHRLRDLDEVGLACARVVIPEAQNHGFGYGLRYLESPRLYQVPVQAGILEEPRSPHEINIIPHPLT